jgi:hypothetical protein
VAAQPSEKMAHPIPKKLLGLVPSLENKVDSPEDFIRTLHKAWKHAGGTLSGKPRHSDRFLSDYLNQQNNSVRSLTPKLVGKTRIKPKDAENLLWAFLSYWPESDAEGAESEELNYEQILSDEEIEDLADLIVAKINALPSLISSQVSRASSELVADDIPGEPVAELVAQQFEDSDAYFIVGTERPLVTQSRTELIGFRDIINQLKYIEDADGKARLLVWILDLGRQRFEDFESRQRYLNVQALITRFKALRLFQDRGKQERWEWLRSRAAFVVLDTLYDQPFERGVKRPSFVTHNVSFNAVAPEWAKNTNFRTLYGSELERLDQRSFSVFLKAEGWPAPTDEDEEAKEFVRYFGYASFKVDNKLNSDTVARGLDLPSPGDSYEDAYRTVYAAALDLLKLENRAIDAGINGAQASAQLRLLGFRLMHLDEFMTL